MRNPLNRRSALALIAVAALAACEPTQLVDPSVAAGLNVVEVSATTTVRRTDTAVPKAQIVETARTKVASALRGASAPSGRPVRAELTVVQFYIANAGAGVLLGSSSSSINTEIRLVDVATGAVVKDSFRVFGVTEPRPTILGAAAIKSPQQELDTITNDLARRARIAVFGT
jgi:hypothetical protein